MLAEPPLKQLSFYRCLVFLFFIGPGTPAHRVALPNPGGLPLLLKPLRNTLKGKPRDVFLGGSIAVKLTIKIKHCAWAWCRMLKL